MPIGFGTQCRGRNSDLDTIKGMLVVMMVAYHCASMGKDRYLELRTITQLFDFLHFAFILIVGFLCGWHYSPRSRISTKATSRRLRVRAGKIMAVFVIVNFCLYAIGGISSHEEFEKSTSSFGTVMRNFVLSMNGELAAAEILYYIAIFLIVASLLVGRMSLPLILVLLLGVSSVGYFSETALFVAFGLTGMLLGILSDAGCLTRIWKKMKQHKWPWPIVLTVYICSLPAARSFARLLPTFKVVVYTVESVLWFISFLAVVELPFGQHIRKGIIQLGRYTLFAYLIQMLIIRIGYMGIQRAGISGPSYYVVNMVFSLMVLCFVVALLDRIRRKYSTIDVLYKLAFQ